MLDFIFKYPLYIPFLALNIFLIYKVIMDVKRDENDENNDEDDGGVDWSEGPDLELPPGVTRPINDTELVH